MGKILVIYDTDGDRRFTESMVRLVAEGARSVEGTEVRTKFVGKAVAEEVERAPIMNALQAGNPNIRSMCRAGGDHG